MDIVIANMTGAHVAPSDYSNLCHFLLCRFLKTYMPFMFVYPFVLHVGGSGYCKYGWSKYAAPSGRCATFLVKLSFTIMSTLVIMFSFAGFVNESLTIHVDLLVLLLLNL